jgi:UDP-glucose 4-epimerase
MPRGDVSVLDNGYRRACEIEDLLDVPYWMADVTDRGAIFRALRALRPKTVFHLAGIHFIPECNAAPDRTLRVNTEGTLNLLQACACSGVEQFLLASTGAVYGDSPRKLTEASPIAPVDIYGWSKLFAEQLCRSHSAEMSVIVARLFNTYGPRETNLHIIPEILRQLNDSDELLLGNTSSRRDYLYVADCASALVRLSQLPEPGSRTVNVSSGQHASVKELVALLSELLNRPLSIRIDPSRLRRADKQMQTADISTLTSLLDWRPSTTLKEGLAQLLEFEPIFALLTQ